MLSLALQILGFVLGIIGFLGTIILCVHPMWKVTVFIRANVVPVQIWEGLWISCLTQSTGQMECNIYNFAVKLPEDLRIARVFMVIAIIVAALGVMLAVAKCTNYIREEGSKVIAVIAAGIAFICAGVLVLIPVCWSTITIILDNYNLDMANVQRKEMGSALYLGWVTGGLLILGGALLILDKALLILARALLVLGSVLLNLGGTLLNLGRNLLILGRALLCVYAPQMEIPECPVKKGPSKTKKRLCKRSTKK